MLYAILCYDEERVTEGLTRDEDGALMDRLRAVQEPFARRGKLGPVARLQPTAAAATLRKGGGGLVVDGPFAETKEQLLGFYVVDCEFGSRGAGVCARACRRCAARDRRLRGPPGARFPAGCAQAMSAARDRRRLKRRAAAGGRRPAALFPRPRHGRRGVPGSLAEGAAQLAGQGPAARSDGLADLRRPQRRARRGAHAGQARRRCRTRSCCRTSATPKSAIAERLDAARYPRRSACGCCSSAAIRSCRANQQIALALRVVSGPFGQGDRARLPGRREGDGAAHHPGQAPRRRGRRSPTRPPTPPSGPSGSRPSRR